MLDAVDLEERFKKALPLLTRQIEGLKLLQKTRKLRPDDDKRVGQYLFLFLLFHLPPQLPAKSEFFSFFLGAGHP